MVNGSLFLYTFHRKKVQKLDSYDNDLLLLMLDDDLFWEEEECSDTTSQIPCELILLEIAPSER